MAQEVMGSESGATIIGVRVKTHPGDEASVSALGLARGDAGVGRSSVPLLL